MELDWPEETRIDIISTNGNDGMHYDEQREQHEQEQPAAPQTNKYDRTIIGKYGSGKCTRLITPMMGPGIAMPK